MRYPVRPIPFAAALILAPLIPAIPALIPVLTGRTAFPDDILIIGAVGLGALVLGVWTWFSFGAAAFWIALRRRERPPCALVGAVAHAISLPLVLLVFRFPEVFRVLVLDGSALEQATGIGNELRVFMVFALFGTAYSLLWGGLFGLLYRAFSRNIRRTPA